MEQKQEKEEIVPKENGGTFKKFCEEKDIEIYSTISETKAAYAERAMKSLEQKFYR